MNQPESGLVMIESARRRKIVPLLIMLVALTGLSFSLFGEAASHGVAELPSNQVADHGDHSHDHESDDESDHHQHHDSGNHTHETVDRLMLHWNTDPLISFRQTAPYAGESPRSFRYRLDRPPKITPIS